MKSIKNSSRYSFKDVSNWTEEEFNQSFNQCRVCGFYYLKEEGLETFKFKGFEYSNICNDCVEDIKSQGSEDNIKYTDQRLAATQYYLNKKKEAK